MATSPGGAAFTRLAPPESPRLGPHEGVGAELGQRADAADIGLPLGHRDHAAGVEQVEEVGALMHWS
jgi:hypothetical protein